MHRRGLPACTHHHGPPPLPCLLSDRKVDIIQKGLGQIQRSFERQIKAGKLTLDDANAAVGRIDTALSLEVRGQEGEVDPGRCQCGSGAHRHRALPGG